MVEFMFTLGLMGLTAGAHTVTISDKMEKIAMVESQMPAALSLPALAGNGAREVPEASPDEQEPAKAVPGTKLAYEVPLFIPEDAEIAPGVYGALYLENRGEDGKWKIRDKTAATVTQAPGGYDCEIILKRRPAENSSILIDFGKGELVELGGGMIQSRLSFKTPEKAKKRGAYSSLLAAAPAKRHPLMRVLRFVAPTALKTGLAAATMGPIGAVAVPASSLVSEIARIKLERSVRKLSPSAGSCPEGDGEIQRLREENGSLQEELLRLKQTLAKMPQGGAH